MADCVLQWNMDKCKGCFLKSGNIEQCDDLILNDNTKIECLLKMGETYKFMGIYQSTKVDKEKLELSLAANIKQRTHII